MLILVIFIHVKPGKLRTTDFDSCQDEISNFFLTNDVLMYISIFHVSNVRFLLFIISSSNIYTLYFTKNSRLISCDIRYDKKILWIIISITRHCVVFLIIIEIVVIIEHWSNHMCGLKNTSIAWKMLSG